MSLFVKVISIWTSPLLYHITRNETRYYRIDDSLDADQLKGNKWLYSMTI
ncbi:hypothetical protein [Bacillus cereus]|nr:hypothetical protein [Bacillus cereus]